MTEEQTQNGIAGAYLTGAMWWYALSVLYPIQALKRSGASISSQRIGDMPEKLPRRGLGSCFSSKYDQPVLLRHRTDHDHLVIEFDRMAEVYAQLVEPFSRPIFDEALQVMSGFLSPDARVLDAGCGPGRELQRVARLVPDGEVVGIDLAAGMVVTAYHATLASGLKNCAFFQADVGNLPKAFTGKFDLIYNCLAHHHYPEPAVATASILRCLRPGGIYCVIDPGPAWYNTISAPIAKWADPGWIGFHTPEEFRQLFRNAGFARTGWIELLPGFGAAFGQKASRGGK